MRMPITQTGLTAFLFAELFGFAAFIYLGAKLFPEHETLVLIGPTIIFVVLQYFFLRRMIKRRMTVSFEPLFKTATSSFIAGCFFLFGAMLRFYAAYVRGLWPNLLGAVSLLVIGLAHVRRSLALKSNRQI